MPYRQPAQRKVSKTRPRVVETHTLDLPETTAIISGKQDSAKPRYSPWADAADAWDVVRQAIQAGWITAAEAAGAGMSYFGPQAMEYYDQLMRIYDAYKRGQAAYDEFKRARDAYNEIRGKDDPPPPKEAPPTGASPGSTDSVFPSDLKPSSVPNTTTWDSPTGPTVPRGVRGGSRRKHSFVSRYTFS